MSERYHGHGTRGLDDHLTTSPSFEGRFGRMFRRLPVFSSDPAALRELGDRMREGAAAPGAPPADNDAIPSGYTYFGQFVDHDITFDPASSLERANDPDALVDFRTPRFDLDSLYGRGPADDAFMYDTVAPAPRLLTGPVIDDAGAVVGPGGGGEQLDLPRNQQGRAIIGDPRNDENTIVSQLHLAFLRFHNVVVDRVAARGLTGGDLLKEAQRIVRWHYQWVVVHDYLKRTIGEETWNQLVVRDGDGEHHRLRHYRVTRTAYMPVEFSVAAFRFGHSQVRGGYRLNERVRVPTFVPEANPGPLADLRGFRRLPAEWQVAWPNFLSIDGGAVQPSRLIDTQLAGALFGLPDAPQDDADLRNLARRNLLRGAALQLPAGEDVAEAMGVAPLTRAQLAEAKVDSTDLGFRCGTPLWFYVLAEAELVAGGRHLGPVGGRIVGETLLGLLGADRLSYVSVKPHWTPAAEAEPLPGGDEGFDLARLLAVATPDRVVRF